MICPFGLWTVVANIRSVSCGEYSGRRGAGVRAWLWNCSSPFPDMSLQQLPRRSPVDPPCPECDYHSSFALSDNLLGLPTIHVIKATLIFLGPRNRGETRRRRQRRDLVDPGRTPPAPTMTPSVSSLNATQVSSGDCISRELLLVPCHHL
jgi:hypothetical protein